ncbi:hypothetical protein EUGRSUZ_I00861 [Eucalyptus grandis]|uniref:TF-B3 domain-containing protein n=2 Tax=Eucalyptus grandis TaxID=71139 RepID=A0A059AMI0_EUCGR|nr:hypothetical protein EUGRSUZ_I00861 [Eucalyptus grandis]
MKISACKGVLNEDQLLQTSRPENRAEQRSFGAVVERRRDPREREGRHSTPRRQVLTHLSLSKTTSKSLREPSLRTTRRGRVHLIPPKPKNGEEFPRNPRELPRRYMEKIQEMQGRDMTLVVEKTLTATDMSRGQSRLSIPNKQIRQGFLSEEEIRMLDRKEGIKVSLIEPCLEVSQLQLKRWNYQSKIFSYVLTERWNGVAHPYERNELMKDVVIQLWSFRVDGSLWFCLKRVEDHQGNGKDGCDLPPIS